MHQEKVDSLEETIAQLKTDLEEARRTSWPSFTHSC